MVTLTLQNLLNAKPSINQYPLDSFAVKAIATYLELLPKKAYYTSLGSNLGKNSCITKY